MARTLDAYMSDYDPLFDELEGVGEAIPAPDFYGRPNFAQPTAPEAQDPIRAMAAQAAQATAPRPPAPRAPGPPSPVPLRPVRDPVDLMGGAYGKAASIGERGRLGVLLDALLTGGKNRQMLQQQSAQDQQMALQRGQYEQGREDKAVTTAKMEQAAEVKRREKEASKAKKAAESAALKDPNSPQNRQFQANLMRTFPQLSPDVARTMTIGRWQQEKTLLDPARRTSAAMAGEEAKEAAATKFGDSRLEREVEAALAKQKALEPGKKRIARAGRSLVVAGQLAKEQRAEERQIAREERAEGRRSSQELQKQAKEYGRALIKAGIPDQKVRVNKAQEAVRSAVSKRGEVFSAKDMAVWKTAGAKGIGLMSEEGKRVAENFQSILNITLKDRSGAAVTNPEFERLKAELGAGLFSSEADLVRALSRIQEIISEHEIAQMAVYDQDAIDIYEGRAKVSRRRVKGGAPAAPAGDKVTVRYKGRTLRIPRNRLKQAVADGAEEVTGG